jgi:hypothetical protein
MNAAAKKERRRKWLKRELRQAKFLFWKSEAKYVYWLVRAIRLPLPDKRWDDWNWKKNMARLEMNALADEVKEAQYELDSFLKKQKKGKKNEGKKSNKGNSRRRRLARR